MQINGYIREYLIYVFFLIYSNWKFYKTYLILSRTIRKIWKLDLIRKNYEKYSIIINDLIKIYWRSHILKKAHIRIRASVYVNKNKTMKVINLSFVTSHLLYKPFLYKIKYKSLTDMYGCSIKQMLKRKQDRKLRNLYFV